ncbi:MAG: signal peptidase I [Nitriliruptorales bacterium]|nr:signal peptidase I [Nitriliruptorales bacterium]
MTRTSTPDNWSADPPDGDVSGSEEASEDHHRSFLAELPVLIAIAFILALVLKTFLIQAFYIPSASMEPTLLIGDRVLVNKVVYKVREPRRGEVVVFSKDDGGIEEAEGNVITRFLRSFSSGLGVSPSGEKDYIKRIIGLPGETIEMRDGVVLVDGRKVPEATTNEGGYLAERDPNDFGPVTVPDGQYFMMGDNRQNSSDSRFPQLGTIPRDSIVGRAFVTIWPVARVDTLPGARYAGAGLPAAQAPAAPVGTVSQPVATLVR